MKQNKLKTLRLITLVLTIVNIVLFIPSVLFLVLLLWQHGKLYYVILFSIVTMVFLIASIVFLIITLVINSLIKTIDSLITNGVKVIDEKVIEEKITEEDQNNIINDTINEPVNEVVNANELTLEETKVTNTNVEEQTLDSESKHETVYKIMEKDKDSYQEYIKNNGEINLDINYQGNNEKNQKKREQSLKNEEVLKSIERTIDFKDCYINKSFLNTNEYSLNMDYIEDVKTNDNELSFILFDIKYKLIFDSVNDLKGYLSYLNNKEKK